ncbi:hypothetical protein B0A48_13611 [Cryoendolithus antarcticus]|uniref:RING-type domain-containing protein n=1 Tax=Cryoendolithus antarcticus TaxID=1507870 RepID=A0A1V8SPU1_9PEZI|nr:hypothetical protein B0A48_13611 [Cryoendolithus antarcticus]
MSSQPPALVKSASSSKQIPSASSPAQTISQTQAFFSNSSATRGSTPARNVAAPRSNQNAKPKHKSKNKASFRGIVDDDAEAEAFSMQNPHGRRGQQSITHLMQFALPPRPQQTHQFRHGGRRGERPNRTWGLGSGYHAVDKSRYIHANYRFIVDPRGDYQAQAEDADLHVDWSNVLQIIASPKTQAASCPICLGDPTAPRMAKCGHIFCTSCLIRYMHSEDAGAPPDKRARYKKCPICWDSIYISETRPVRFYAGQEGELPREGGDIVLRLVKRNANATLAMPRESADPLGKGEEVPWYFAAEVMDYARVMKGSEEYMLQQYDEALKAVEYIEKEDELIFGEDAEWTGRAKRMLHEAKEKVKGIGNPPEQHKKPELKPAPKLERPPIQFNDNDENTPDMYIQRHANTPALMTTLGSHTGTAPAEPDAQQDANYVPRTIAEMRQRQYEKPQPNEYLFYHALQHYYLSSLDIRILQAAFGSYTQFPSSILPRVDRVSSGHVVDDELRKKVKYLAHLPYGCEVGFLECDWTDTVSPEVLEPFKVQIDRRRRRNEDKEAREEKERVRGEKAAEKEYAAVRRKRPSFSSVAISSDQMPSLSGSIPDSTEHGSPPWPHRATSGFASLASPSTSPSAHRTVWGTAAVSASSPELDAAMSADLGQEGDGWLEGWEKDLLSHDHSLMAQAELMSLNEGSSKMAVTSAAAGAGKKGKKGKKITLMSTTNRRGA